MRGNQKNIENELSIDSETTVIDLDRLEEEEFSTGNESKSGNKLGFIQGLALVIGLQVGSGIFSSPNQIHIHAGSYGASLLIWCVSGFLAWSGASCYAELGCAIPTNGGTQAYLSRIFNEYVSFLYSWTALVVLKPGSASIIAIVLGEYLSQDAIIRRLFAIAAVVITTAINLFSYGVSAGTYYLVFKGILLLCITILGFTLFGMRDHSEGVSFWEGTHSIGDITVALYGGIWAYDGWDNLNFLTGEMKNPKKDLSRVISTAMASVIAAYCLVNCAYFGALSGPDLDKSTSVALTVASMTHSKVIEVLVSGGIALSCAGALNASMVSMAKLVQVVAETKVLPQKLTQHHWALISQSLITICYCCVGEFKALVTFYGAAGYIFYLTTVIGLLVLRYREPNLHRPYRVWFFVPFVFIALSLVLIIRTAFIHPLLLLTVFAFIFIGSPLYYFSKNLHS